MSKQLKIIKFGTIVIVLISMAFGAYIIKASSFLLHETVANGNVPKNQTEVISHRYDRIVILDADLFTVNEVSKSPGSPSNYDPLFSTMICVSSISLIAGCLQFAVSLFVLVLSCRSWGGGSERRIVFIWIGFHVGILLAIGGSHLSIITIDRAIKLTSAIQVFLPACVSDVIFLLISLAVKIIFIRVYLRN